MQLGMVIFHMENYHQSFNIFKDLRTKDADGSRQLEWYPYFVPWNGGNN